MSKFKRTVLPFIIIIFVTNSIYAQDSSKSTGMFAGLQVGYNGGLGTEVSFMLKDFALDFPFDIRFGAGYTIFNPGNAADARRIFINNATNGVPEKKGSAFNYRLDFMMARTVFNIPNSYFVIGPRYSSFKGNFKYIGGNENFDVVSRQWGIGAGLENHFNVTGNMGIYVAYGFDYYFRSTLTGHDTSYSPDNDNVNSRNDNQNNGRPFTYKDADKAISQPKYVARIMIGINFKL